MGAGKWRTEYSESLRGRTVVILPDNDEAGQHHAATVAAALLGVAASVRIVELPGLADKGDVTDWRDKGGTFEQFIQLVDVATPMDSAMLFDLRARWGIAEEDAKHQVRREEAGDWPKPEPIQNKLPPVAPFSEDLLPDSLRPLVRDVTERMQVPVDLPAVVALLCLAGVVNRRATIQPKANDTGWVVVPNLWGGLIARPGFMKSPVLAAVTRPLNQIQTEWWQQHEEALKDYTRAKEEYDLRRTAWKEQYKANTKKGKVVPDRPEDDEPQKPKLQRLIVNDPTFEALHVTMSENPAGVLLIRDELTGWLSELDRAGREGERPFHLQAWNGDTGYTMDRIGRGTIHVPACCESILGGIQPGRLRSYLVDALKDGPGDDGLIQRLQLLVWPDTAPSWKYVDRAPAAASEDQVA
jgi:putative DNA primase/helicase